MSTTQTPNLRNFSQSRMGDPVVTASSCERLFEGVMLSWRRGRPLSSINGENRRLTDLALIWYLISSDFNRVLKPPKRRSSIRLDKLTAGTRHGDDVAHKVRPGRDFKAASSRDFPAWWPLFLMGPRRPSISGRLSRWVGGVRFRFEAEHRVLVSFESGVSGIVPEHPGDV
jgi:hypothetical protein